jgi:ABC-type spermidine/putrescine transport system permease subunit II
VVGGADDDDIVQRVEAVHLDQHAVDDAVQLRLGAAPATAILELYDYEKDPQETINVVVAAILCFAFSWNYFLFALVLSGFSTKTAIVASFKFIGEGVTNWGALMAAATIIALPPLVLTLLIQRHLVDGLFAGAVKG